MPVRRDPRTGRWLFRTIVHFSDGTKTRISGRPGCIPFLDLPQSKVGAQEAERRAISEAISGTPRAVAAPAAVEAPRPKTIREHAETFVDTYKPGSKESEKREKRKALNGHLLPFFGEMTIEELTQKDVDTFAQRELARGCAVKTVNNRLAVLSTLIKYVTGEKSKLRFKLAGMAGELHAVDPDEVERLLEVSAPRERALILFAAEAGLRAGEIRGAQWGDIRDGKITIRRALDNSTNAIVPPKHNKSRSVPLSPRLEATLAALPRCGLWIIAHTDGSLVRYDQLHDIVNDVYARAGVPRPPKPTHCLRHSFGTAMAKRVPLPILQKLMGHASPDVTMRYIDISEDDKRAAIEAVFGARRGTGVAPTWHQTSSKRDKAP